MEQPLQTETKFRLVNGGYNATTQPELKDDKYKNLLNRLPGILQTTLQLDELLLLFQQQIQQVLSFDSYHYLNADADFENNTAPKCHHRCTFALEINNVYLGEISITRRKSFHESELKQFEGLLCTLIYPLRNCLMYKKAVDLTFYDGMTGLYNRATYDSNINREIELSRRQGTPLSLIVLDIDYFKRINDKYGHSSGDKALKQLADTIRNTIRSCDLAFRYGGEEFTLILSSTNAQDATNLAERLRAAVAGLICGNKEQAFSYTISMGITQLIDDDNAFSLFDRADKALYKAKHAGRNTFHCA